MAAASRSARALVTHDTTRRTHASSPSQSFTTSSSRMRCCRSRSGLVSTPSKPYWLRCRCVQNSALDKYSRAIACTTLPATTRRRQARTASPSSFMIAVHICHGTQQRNTAPFPATVAHTNDNEALLDKNAWNMGAEIRRQAQSCAPRNSCDKKTKTPHTTHLLSGRG